MLLCAIQQSWSDHKCVNLSLHFNWHPPVTQHSTASLPVSPCCTHSLRNLCCHASCLLYAWTEIYLKWCTLCSSSPRILTGSLPWPLSCPRLKSTNWVVGLLVFIPMSSNALLQVSKCSVMSVSSSPHSIHCHLKTPWLYGLQYTSLFLAMLKLNLRKYPAIHTHYSWSNCTISN